MLFLFVVIYLHVYVHVHDKKNINFFFYRITALQISRLNKRIDELEQLEKLEEEIDNLKESFKGNKYCSYQIIHLIVLLTKIEVFRREIILTKY